MMQPSQTARFWRKLFTRAALLVLLSLGAPHPGRADAPQAFLKVNQYYVLFTNPIIPFVDHQGSFIVGLAGFADVLGAHLSSSKGSATVRLGKDVVRFVVGSKTADINGQAVRMAEAPITQATLQYKPNARAPLPPGMRRSIIPANQLLVPVAALVRTFHLHASWQPQRRTLLIRRDQPLPEDGDIDVENIERFERPVSGPDTFVPLSSKIRFGAMPGDKTPRAVARAKGMKRLELLAQNTSGKDFVEGQVYINIFTNAYSKGIFAPSIDIHYPPQAALKAGSARLDLTEISGPGTQLVGYIHYVFAWLVVRDMRLLPD